MLNTIFFSLIAGLATIAGILVLLWQKDWVRKNSVYIISFAAGVLIAVAFFDLLPESIELYSSAMAAALVSFVIFYLIEFAIQLKNCKRESIEDGGGHDHTHPLGWLSFIGIGFHSLVDGLAIALGFEISPELGLVTTLSVILHELPEGITIMSILLHYGASKKSAFWRSVAVALATPTAAIVTLLFIKDLPSEILGLLLAVAAGSFIYVAAADLIPETHRRVKWGNFVALGLGIALIAVIG
jgi:zinc and cadmium transporter